MGKNKRSKKNTNSELAAAICSAGSQTSLVELLNNSTKDTKTARQYSQQTISYWLHHPTKGVPWEMADALVKVIPDLSFERLTLQEKKK